MPRRRRGTTRSGTCRSTEAGEQARLDDLLLDPEWLRAKLDATGSVASLLSDYDRYGSGEAHSLIGRTLRLSAGICGRDKRQLLPQLLGRLMASAPVAATDFFQRCRSRLPPPAILERHPALTPPGAEAVRLEGHSVVCAGGWPAGLRLV